MSCKPKPLHLGVNSDGYGVYPSLRLRLLKVSLSVTCLPLACLFLQSNLRIHSVGVDIKQTTQAKRQKICMASVTSDCPGTHAYMPACKRQVYRLGDDMTDASDDFFPEPSTLPRLGVGHAIDDPEFVPKLLSFFHKKRVALVGDSLMRQWFETLSCRLGLTQEYFPLEKVGQTTSSDLPLHVKQLIAKNEDIIHPLHKPPYGMANAHGYARAGAGILTDNFRKADDEISLSMVNNTNSSRLASCTPFSTLLEYYHLDTWDNILRASDGDAPLNLLQYISQTADIIVFNLGLHYENPFYYSRDLNQLLKDCTALKRLQNYTKHCLFRETFPRHWVYKHYVGDASNASKTSNNAPPSFASWKFSLREVRHRCGPFLPGQYPIRFNHNDILEEAIVSYNVTVVKVEDLFRDAIAWHMPGDCSHFCQDNEVWDWAHVALLEAAAVDGLL